MNELSLFSGAGGGLLGTKLLGFRHIGYVEWDGYCQQVIAQRIADGFLEEAPIFGDIREFVKSGAAREYRGIADVVTAGFPCQPFSTSGQRRAGGDEANMWPATADVLREVRPGYALLENVPGLLTTGYCERIFGDLADLGFDARWRVFSGHEDDAPQPRERLFILAHAQGQRPRAVHAEPRVLQASAEDRTGLARSRRTEHPTHAERLLWPSDADLVRVADGFPDRVDRITAAGNAQIPRMVVRAWTELTR